MIQEEPSKLILYKDSGRRTIILRRYLDKLIPDWREFLGHGPEPFWYHGVAAMFFYTDLILEGEYPSDEGGFNAVRP